MKKIFIMCLVCVTSILIGCTNNKDTEITTEGVVVQENKSIDVYGSVTTNKIQSVYLDFPLTIEKIYVKSGESVKAGDVLATFNYDKYTQEIQKKEQEIQLLELDKKNIEQEVSTTYIDIKKYQQDIMTKKKEMNEGEDILILNQKLEIAKEKTKLAIKSYEANMKILEAGGISTHELELLEVEWKKAEQEEKEIILNIQGLKNKKQQEIEDLENDINKLQVKLKNQQIENEYKLDRIDINLNILKLELEEMRSKLDKNYIQGNQIIITQDTGIIHSLSIEEDMILNGNESVSIAQIIDMKDLMISINVPEVFINDIKLGQDVSVKFYAYNREEFKGEISYIEESASALNGENMVRVQVQLKDNEQKKILKYGYELEASINLN